MTAAVSIHKQQMKLMGNQFEISVCSNDAAWAASRIEEAVDEIRRIEKLLTTFNAESQTNEINRMAGIAPVKVDREMFDLVKRSLRISSLTQGAFDLSYGSLDKRFWNFDQSMKALPDLQTAKKSVKLINYRNIVLDEHSQTIYLLNKGMRIGFGGIGKGYAAERAKLLMQSKGVTSGIVNASGDLTTWGLQPDGTKWTVGIAHPDFAGSSFSHFEVTDMSVATSGNYEKFVWIGGKKYSHTINPRTGFPVHGIKSVTIISSNAEFADAMTTPVMIMGIGAGLNMVNQVNGLGCIIIDDHNKLYTSNNIQLQ